MTAASEKLASWDVGSHLKSARGKVALRKGGWALLPEGQKYVNDKFNLNDKSALKREDLRKLVETIENDQAKGFLFEAITCLESKCFRAAIVMSWILAIHYLYDHIINNKLSEFNSEAERVNPKWQKASTHDDLARMKESDFLNRIESISIIGKSVKQALEECLKRRNSCGHPNSLEITENNVAHHIDTLMKNVLTKFAI